MNVSRWFAWSALSVFLGAGLAGCSGGDKKAEDAAPPKESAANESPAGTPEPGEKEEVLLEPFDPPTLAELDAKAQWEPQPVGDTLQMMRAKQAKETPLVSVEEALKLRNTSPDLNDKILSVLGRVATDDAQADFDAVINRHSRVDVRSTNPILTSSFAEIDINGLTGFGMFGFDWNLEPLATSETVKSWEASKDRLYDKVVLRDDLTWSDGKPITAHDIVFTFQTIMNPKVPVPAVRAGTDKLRWIHAYDDHTVVFFHKESLATNVWNVNFPIIPKHVYEESLKKDVTLKDSDYHVQLEDNPVCGGAYTISKRTRGQEIVLTRRDSWYMHNGKQVREKPYFKEVRFRIIEDPNIALLALKNGEIDEMELNPEQWRTQTTDDEFYRLNTKASGVEWTGFQFLWNLKTPFFSDIRVRRAMAYAFNYKEMLDTLFYGLYQPSNGIFYNGAWMAPTNPAPPYTQDLDKAEQLLDDAGWQDHDGDGIRDKEINGKLEKFEFGIVVPTIPERIKVCTLLKENLAQIGIICNVRPIEFAVLQEKMMNHEFQAAFGGWGTGSDPDTSENIWGTGHERNYGFYSNKEVDKLFDLGRKEFDRKKRGALYAKIHELTYADQPYTWLFYRNSFYAFNKQLRGYTFSPRGPYHYGPGFSSIYKVKP
jgi:peptide/nickel transport system substrate-binding protein